MFVMWHGNAYKVAGFQKKKFDGMWLILEGLNFMIHSEWVTII